MIVIAELSVVVVEVLFSCCGVIMVGGVTNVVKGVCCVAPDAVSVISKTSARL